MRLTQNFVLIEPVKVKAQMIAGIHIAGPDPMELGKVVEVGPGNMGPGGKLVPCSVKKGDVVYAAKTPGDIKIPLGERKFGVLIRDHAVIGIWEGSEDDLVLEEE